METELKKLGFSDKEAKIYLALLELGEASVQNVARKAKVNRATTYVNLQSLMKKGVVSTVEKGKKTHFAAENPSTLLRIIKSEEEEIKFKEDSFRKILPEFEAIFNKSAEKPKVRYFEGKEGMQSYREDVLTNAEKEILEIYPFDEVQGLFTDKENNEFYKKRRERGIAVRSIYAKQDIPFTEFLTKGTRLFLDKKKFPFSCDISIYGSHLAFTTLKGKHITVIIEDKEVADTMRLIFELAWVGAKEKTK